MCIFLQHWEGPNNQSYNTNAKGMFGQEVKWSVVDIMWCRVQQLMWLFGAVGKCV